MDYVMLVLSSKRHCYSCSTLNCSVTVPHASISQLRWLDREYISHIVLLFKILGTLFVVGMENIDCKFRLFCRLFVGFVK